LIDRLNLINTQICKGGSLKTLPVTKTIKIRGTLCDRQRYHPCNGRWDDRIHSLINKSRIT